MSLTNSRLTYGSISKTLHWLALILIIGMLCLGSIMGDVESKSLQGLLYLIHKSTGLIALVVMLLFLLWSVVNVKPTLPPEMPGWEKRLAHYVHGLLYFVAIAMPVTGWMMSTAAGKAPNFFKLVVIPMPWIPQSKALASFCADLHEILAWVLFGLIALHALGALKHFFIDKNGILGRMLKF